MSSKGRSSDLKTSVWKAFDSFYGSPKIWGSRWSALKEALQKPKRHVARINSFITPDELLKIKQELFGANSDDVIVKFGIENQAKVDIFEVEQDEESFSKAPPKKLTISGVCPYYVMVIEYDYIDCKL
jgi:hypothetical protein